MANFYTPGFPVDVYRRRLPHWQQPATWCFITFRLNDSLPASLLRVWRQRRDHWFQLHPEPRSAEETSEYHRIFTVQIEQWLDRGSGSCVLGDPEVGLILSEILQHFDGERYHLDSFVIMPNHVHVLLIPLKGWALKEILKSWKSYSAKQINVLKDRTGSLWQKESWDRLIRDEHHFHRCRTYIRKNPEKAGLKQGYVLWPTEPGAMGSS